MDMHGGTLLTVGVIVALFFWVIVDISNDIESQKQEPVACVTEGGD